MTPPPEKTRVLRFIARLNVGGPAKHVCWLATGLDPERFDQTLVAGQVGPGEDDLGPWLLTQGAAYRTLPGLGRAINPVADLACVARAVGLMLKERPHIVATHASKAGFVGRAALMVYRPLARLTGRPVPKAVHTFHGHTFRGYFGPLTGRLFLAIERFLARRATWRIVVISPRQLAEIRDEFDVGRAGQFRLVPLGIDLEPFADPEPGRAAFRAEMAGPPDQALIGAVGRLAPIKNYGLMVDAAHAFGQSRPDLAARCRFLLIGGGPTAMRDELVHKAAGLGLGGGFSLLGNRADPERFFPGLDALLLTSDNEGTPVAILEAGACARPVIATEVGGVPDLLGETTADLGGGLKLRQRGLTAPPGDANALAQGLAWLLDHPDQAADLGRALQAYVRQAHSKQRLIADIAILYADY